MECNVGRVDQALRVVMGLGLLSMIWWAPESGYWGLLGLAPILSGALRYCPGYRLLGVKTTPPDTRRG